jgi:hypothetical protein
MHRSPRTKAYNLGFTAASLRPELARIIAEKFLTTGDWPTTKQWVLSTNALQCHSASTAVRFEGELRKRLQSLTAEQIKIMAHATEDDRTAMAWLAAMKHSAILFDFAAEVLREKLALHDPVLRPSDYETFVNHQSAIHPRLTELSVSSKYKIRQVLLKMLEEAGILQDGPGMGTIHRPVLSPALIRVISTDNPRWLAGFLVPDFEISFS